MHHQNKIALIGVYVLGLSSCTVMDTNTYSTYPTYPAYLAYTDTVYPATLNDNTNTNYDYGRLQKQEVVVPDSYHVSEQHSPVSFKDRDEIWVNSQNPQGYTIELVEGDKASKVARVLYQTPKNDRMAQIHAVRDGKTHYKGVYGTYSSAEEAQKALNTLPEEIKHSAAVVNWKSVQ